MKKISRIFSMFVILGVVFTSASSYDYQASVTTPEVFLEPVETCSTTISVVSKSTLAPTYSPWKTEVTIAKGSTGSATISTANTSSSSRSYTTSIVSGTKWATNAQISASIGATIGSSISKTVSYTDKGSKTQKTELQMRKKYINQSVRQQKKIVCRSAGGTSTSTTYATVKTRKLGSLECRTYRS